MSGKKRVMILALAIMLVISLVVPYAFSQDNNNNTNSSQPAAKKKFKGSVTIKSGTPNDYNFRIVAGLPVIDVAPGRATRFKLYARKNPEGEPLHNVRIKITNTEFQATIDNPVIEELRNEEMAVLYVSVVFPPDAMHGDYILNIEAESDEFPSSVYTPAPPIIIRLRNKAIAPRILLIAGIALLLSLLLWRKFSVK